MKISVFGVGYVWLVTGTCLAEQWHDVLCVDVDESKVNNLRNGIVPIYEPGLTELVVRNVEEWRLHFSLDAREWILFWDVVFNAVGTPPDKDNNDRADLQYIESVARSFALYLDRPKVLINKSTVPVGTADRCTALISSILEKEKNKVWFEVVSNPEFLREWAAIKDFMNPDRIICGVGSQRAKDLVTELYEPIMRSYRSIFFTDPKSAEITKYASNAYLATKISFINEIANFAERVGANINDIARGMGMDKRIGPTFLHAGIGYGGSCFPKDVKALIASGYEVWYDFSIIKATESINRNQKMLPLSKLSKYFTDLTDKTVAVLWLSFKPKTDDIRESASIDIVNNLLNMGVRKVQLFDPVAMGNFILLFPPSNQVAYATTSYDALQSSDILLLLTEWDEFRALDFARVKKIMTGSLILDWRNIWDKHKLQKLWFVYEWVGK